MVPDEYLELNMLLGCDILAQARYSIDARRKVMIWGDALYVLNFIQPKLGKVSKVAIEPADLSQPQKQF